MAPRPQPRSSPTSTSKPRIHPRPENKRENTQLAVAPPIVRRSRRVRCSALNRHAFQIGTLGAEVTTRPWSAASEPMMVLPASGIFAVFLSFGLIGLVWWAAERHRFAAAELPSCRAAELTLVPLDWPRGPWLRSQGQDGRGGDRFSFGHTEILLRNISRERPQRVSVEASDPLRYFAFGSSDVGSSPISIGWSRRTLPINLGTP